jgi:hypothetical protein
MLRFKVNGLTQVGQGLTRELRNTVDRLGNELFNEILKTTPVDTGTARNGWRLKKKPASFTIENPVPYVPVLDKGRHSTSRGMRGSKQAPKGIVGPSLNSIKRKN